MSDAMKVRCKVRVTSKHDHAHWDPKMPGKKQSTVVLTPVSDEANKTWAQYTPSGELKLMIDNPAAVDAFGLGEFFYVDFTPAPHVDPT